MRFRVNPLAHRRAQPLKSPEDIARDRSSRFAILGIAGFVVRGRSAPA